MSLSKPLLRYVGPHYLLAIANIPAQADKVGWGYPDGCRGEWIDPSQRQAQKWLLKVLIDKCPDLHAVARHWGTPTDIVRYTGNIGFWCSILEDCGFDVRSFLASDSTILRGIENEKRMKLLNVV